jgi:hypothetical protein
MVGHVRHASAQMTSPGPPLPQFLKRRAGALLDPLVRSNLTIHIEQSAPTRQWESTGRGRPTFAVRPPTDASGLP